MSIFSKFPGIFSTSIGIDLGTANVLVYLKGRGVIMNEPSYVALDNETKKVLAVGNEAKRMAAVAPGSITVIRPKAWSIPLRPFSPEERGSVTMYMIPFS